MCVVIVLAIGIALVFRLCGLLCSVRGVWIMARASCHLLKQIHHVYSLRMWHLEFQTHPMFVTAKGMSQPCYFVHGLGAGGVRTDVYYGTWTTEPIRVHGAAPCFIRPRTRTPERHAAATPPLSWRGGYLARKTSLASSLVTLFPIFKDSQWFALISYGSATILAQASPCLYESIVINLNCVPHLWPPVDAPPP